MEKRSRDINVACSPAVGHSKDSLGKISAGLLAGAVAIYKFFWW